MTTASAKLPRWSGKFWHCEGEVASAKAAAKILGHLAASPHRIEPGELIVIERSIIGYVAEIERHLKWLSDVQSGCVPDD
jgi:hypothetical protein